MREPTTGDAQDGVGVPSQPRCAFVRRCAVLVLPCPQATKLTHHWSVRATTHSSPLRLITGFSGSAGTAGAAVSALHIAGVQQAGWASLVWCRLA